MQIRRKPEVMHLCLPLCSIFLLSPKALLCGRHVGLLNSGYSRAGEGFFKLKQQLQRIQDNTTVRLGLTAEKNKNIEYYWKHSVYYSCYYAPRYLMCAKRISQVRTQQAKPANITNKPNSDIKLRLCMVWFAVLRLYMYSSTVHSVKRNFLLAFWEMCFTVKVVTQLGLSCSDLL